MASQNGRERRDLNLTGVGMGVFSEFKMVLDCLSYCNYLALRCKYRLTNS